MITLEIYEAGATRLREEIVPRSLVNFRMNRTCGVAPVLSKAINVRTVVMDELKDFIQLPFVHPVDLD